MSMTDETEFFGLPMPEDVEYWERWAAAGLNQPPRPTNGEDPQDRPSEEDELEFDSWRPINLAELEERPSVRPTLGDAGIAYPGKRHVFSGPQESAKTLAAYALGLEVIRGGGRVAVIDFEMGRWEARDRLRDLGATPLELGRIIYLDPDGPATGERIERLVALKPELVIVDAAAGAYNVQGLDDNKRGDVERFGSMYVTPFWKAGIATLVLDHVVKNVEGRGKYAIGSERKVGATEVHLGFEVVTPIKRGSSGVYKIITHKDRGGFLKRGRLADLHLESDPETHAISWEFREAEAVDEEIGFLPTRLMQNVSTWLERNQHDQPHSQRDVRGAVTGRAEYVADAIKGLVKLGYATASTGPAGANLVSHVSTYTESMGSEAVVPGGSQRFPEPLSGPVPVVPHPQDGNQGAGTTQSSGNAATGSRVPFDVYSDEAQRMLDDDDSSSKPDDGIPF
jgi:hypothetical protein